MHVRSGAGNFHLEVETLDIEDGTLVLRGIVDDWPSRTYVEPSEIGQILRLTLRPKVLRFLLMLGWDAALAAGRARLKVRRERKGG